MKFYVWCRRYDAQGRMVLSMPFGTVETVEEAQAIVASEDATPWASVENIAAGLRVFIAADGSRMALSVQEVQPAS